MSRTLFRLLSARFTALAVCLLALWAPARSQITPSADSYTNTALPTTNFGAKTLLDVQSDTQNTYIQFDLSSIPSGYTSSNVAKASLKLYVNTVTTAGSFNVDFVNGTWTENTITANLPPALGATIAASVPLAKSQAHDYILIDITAAVGAWLDSTQSNDGIALVGNSPLNATFDSKESTTQSHPPELDIVFTGGGGGSITGITTASGSGLTGGGNSGTLNLSLQTNCASGQALVWNGSSWACTNLSGGGTITGVTAGIDLTGGGSSGNVTLNVDTTKVAQLSLGNTFTGNQTVSGNLSATGVVTGNSFNIGSNLFAFGNLPSESAFLGFAGNSTSTAVSNTGVGPNALAAVTSGEGNTAAGAEALYSDTNGRDNTATGAGALRFNTTGGSNTANGWSALTSNLTGGYNTATGIQALQQNTSGSLNTAIGEGALWSNVTGSYSTAVGAGALSRNTVSAITAVGYDALQSNTTGISNTATGNNALQANTTGSINTADGQQALASNTTGGNNTAVGSGALATNSTGSSNVAIGDNALGGTSTGGGNTAAGSQTLLYNTTGLMNSALGGYALYGNQTGSSNTAVGYSAFYTNMTGSNNTALGFSAGSDFQHTGLSNASAIGAFAFVTESNAMVLGSINGVNGATADALVGIGITSPTYKLHVGNFLNSVRVEGPATPGTGGLAASFGGYGDFSIDAPGCTECRFVVKENGNVGVGSGAPSRILTVGKGWGNAIADGWDTYSSRRWKTNIQTLPNALAKVEQLRGVSYDLKSNGKHEIGVIAEEVGQVVPEVVSYEENGKDAQGVDYSRLTALLIEAVKGQQKEFRQQQTELAQALRQVQQQQIQLRAQSTAIRSLEAEVRETRETLQKVKAQVAASQLAVVAAR